MKRYLKGDRVEVLNDALEHSWYLARIVEGDGDMYTVRYDGQANGMVFEVVLAKYIRPRPPVVEFSNWSCGDLVHVLDNYAWKLATVLVVGNRLFIVRVVGSMLDLIVDAPRIRVRHCWQDGRWTVIGKGPPVSDVRQPNGFRKMISDSRDMQKKKSVLPARRTIARQKSHNVAAEEIKWTAPGTLDQTGARRKVAKISRTTAQCSPSTLNQTDTWTRTRVRSRLTEEPQGKSNRLPGRVTAKETQEQQEDCAISYVGSCSIDTNTNSITHQNPVKYADHRCDGDVSDAESSTEPSHRTGNQCGIFVLQRDHKEAVFDRRATEAVTIQLHRPDEDMPPSL